MEALKCPVCEGKQTVPLGFYETGHLEVERQKCRSCDGKGYLLTDSRPALPTLLIQGLQSSSARYTSYPRPGLWGRDASSVQCVTGVDVPFTSGDIQQDDMRTD
jgi:hypothetical protein